MEAFLRIEPIVRRALSVAIIGIALYGVILIVDSSDRIKKADAVLAKEAPSPGPRPDCKNLEGKEAGDCVLRLTFYGSDQLADRDAKTRATASKAVALSQEDNGWGWLLVALFLWPAYMLVRWILTGKSRPKVESV